MELGKVEGLCGFCRNKELDSEYVQYGIAKFDGDKLIIIPRFVRKIRIYFHPQTYSLRTERRGIAREKLLILAKASISLLEGSSSRLEEDIRLSFDRIRN